MLSKKGWIVAGTIVAVLGLTQVGLASSDILEKHRMMSDAGMKMDHQSMSSMMAGHDHMKAMMNKEEMAAMMKEMHGADAEEAIKKCAELMETMNNHHEDSNFK